MTCILDLRVSLVLVGLTCWKSKRGDWKPHGHTPWREWQPWRGSHRELPHIPASWCPADAGFHDNSPDSRWLLQCHRSSQSAGTAWKHTDALLCVWPYILVPLSVCAAYSTSGVCFATSLIRVVTFFLTYSSGSLRQTSAAGNTSASITISARLTECLLTWLRAENTCLWMDTNT